MRDFPVGTVTFLFTDIEGSTRLLEALKDDYAGLLADQREILREIFSNHEGQEVDTQGDSFFYSFPRASQALNAAIEAQRALAAHTWPQDVELHVRMGLHTGEPLPQAEGYVGMDVHRAARIASAGHGGQILLSETTTPLILDSLPEGANLVELGRHRLKDMRRPERITQVLLDGARSDFPPLKSLEALPPDRRSEVGPIPAPDFLTKETPLEKPIFVGREQELRRLDEKFERALHGEGCIGLVAGGPGRGKTALLEAFSSQVARDHPDILLAWGECSSRAGQGDPFHPFRQILRTLSGDLKSMWISNRSSNENIEQMWRSVPLVARSIVEVSPQLVNRLISGSELRARAGSIVTPGAPWLERLATLADQVQSVEIDTDQNALFTQFEDLIGELASHHPLLIILDDLQWIDNASVDLLFHLSRHLAGKRILILGAYRPEEIVLERERESHPLQSVLPEFRRYFGDIELDLTEVPIEEGRQFIDQLVDSEPNHLGEDFRTALFAHTEGHPLFTIELLRSMQERGDLERDGDGRWVQTKSLGWDEVPARIEGVIEERFNRLDPTLQEILQVASVEGEVFSAEVLSQILAINDRELYRALGQDLDRKHRLVQERGAVKIGEIQFSRFAFRHVLIQDYVYHSIGGLERKALHAGVGESLEMLYGEQSHRIAAQLAEHFSLGGIRDKAVQYLIESGDQARLLYALPEALNHYRQALDLLEGSGRAELIARTLLKIGLIHNAQGDHEGANRINQQAFELWEPIRASWEAAHSTEEGKTLRIAIAEPRSLDPALISDDVSIFISNQLFEGLVTVDQESNVLPAAAERWQILDGGRCYRFHLRSDLKWSDGSGLSAHDFVRTWKRNLRISDQAPMTDLLFVIKNAEPYALGELGSDSQLGLRALNDHTLEVELEDPVAYLPHLLTLPVAFPVPEAHGSLGSSADQGYSFVCNGAFRLTDLSSDRVISMERNPHYRGAYSGNVIQVECSVYEQYRSAFDRFDRGEFDIVSMVTSGPATVRHASQRYADELKFFPYPSTFFVTFCCDRRPFDDARVRKAFVHAIDREALISSTSRGQYTPALGGFLPTGLAGHQADIGLAYDPARAKELLTEAGFGEAEGFPQVELLFTGADPHNPLIEDLCQSWRDVLGVIVTPTNVTWQEFMRRRDEDPAELSTMGFSADYPDPDGMLRVLFHSEQGFNPSRFKSDEVDNLVELAARTLESAKRMDAYRQVDRILSMDQAVIMPLGYGRLRILVKPGIDFPAYPLRFKEVHIS
jgi:ABC-type oligopeptide transport system substrate-binding subunit/class 3 adenylate cyclase